MPNMLASITTVPSGHLQAGYLRSIALAAYLLAITMDSLDFVGQDQLLFCIDNVTAYYTLNHDKSAENIFSNSIDAWKNIGSNTQ